VPGQFIINSRKYDGSIRRSWSCEMVRLDHDLLVFEGIFDVDVDHKELGFIKSGTVSHEYYWLGRWYNVFRFMSPDGSFRNYYCNINLPPTLSDNVLDYVDLDIDIVVWPDKTYQVLDLDEFETHARDMPYPADVRAGAFKALDELMEMIETGSLPEE
jgi:protein associated with RNAse G/E